MPMTSNLQGMAVIWCSARYCRAIATSLRCLTGVTHENGLPQFAPKDDFTSMKTRVPSVSRAIQSISPRRDWYFLQTIP